MHGRDRCGERKKDALRAFRRLVDYAPICGDPRQSPLLPAVAIQKVLSRTGLSLDRMALIEINEAFAAMPLVGTLVLSDFDRKKTEKLRERVNVNGGAIAIGHPIGATGARLLMHMLYGLRRRGGGYGVVAICGAIGQADAAIVEV
jgi:acetyl-CoA C-acetyltransferase